MLVFLVLLANTAFAADPPTFETCSNEVINDFEMGEYTMTALEDTIAQLERCLAPDVQDQLELSRMADELKIARAKATRKDRYLIDSAAAALQEDRAEVNRIVMNGRRMIRLYRQAKDELYVAACLLHTADPLTVGADCTQ